MNPIAEQIDAVLIDTALLPLDGVGATLARTLQDAADEINRLQAEQDGPLTASKEHYDLWERERKERLQAER